MKTEKPKTDSEMERLLAPDLRTVRLFEIQGRPCRIFLTTAGTIVCEQRDSVGAWSHVPLRDASFTELMDMFVIRRSLPDEEIARTLASYQYSG